ncbi:MAG: energy transducer TonB [Dysgonomonas sp.]
MKTFLIAVFSFLSLSAVAQPGFNSPSYPGGEVELYKFINDRLVYPPLARKAGVEGRVLVRFVVSEKGDVQNVHVIKSLHPDCDSVAVRIVRSMPRWKPGQQRGKDAAITFNLPILFRKSMEDVDGEIFFYGDSVTTPEFPGGEVSLFRFIREKTRRTEPGQYTQGRVDIRFIVTKEGRIKYPKIIKGIDPMLDEEAMQIIRLMPDWMPGRRNGEAVNVYFTMPVLFRLMN